MTYRVVMHSHAVRDLDDAFRWAARRAPHTALRWLDRFQTALHTLENSPQRCSLARENEKVDFELREYHFGRLPHRFRVIFTIDDDAVRILRIRRAQRRALGTHQIEEARDSKDSGASSDPV